ncbi:hypothetical protein MKS88_000476 [Plasmodium brasilianum]|uniref:Uncharacterized protein n=2 Tax=Plasmodium (Plasmodium) TaxID=418103 RepID=A0A1A8X5N0_PLAMA|nr:conserved Plasmodium protein, unknown function [Plasmodium malariae]KAI4841238.1 hypothetical protein MKS88_000476 [Plasmodium brasilianum]SBS99510.1 conserved Plasmodium protein, unknown function [Plasmodium malariae]SBT86925.1 conserved Plasmodium protein, unknown function [Plasmodium malariae]
MNYAPFRNINLHCYRNGNGKKSYKRMLNISSIESIHNIRDVRNISKYGYVTSITRLTKNTSAPICKKCNYVSNTCCSGKYSIVGVSLVRYVPISTTSNNNGSSSSRSVEKKRAPDQSVEDKEGSSNNLSAIINVSEKREPNNSNSSNINANTEANTAYSNKEAKGENNFIFEEGKKKRSKMKIIGYVLTTLACSYIIYKVYKNDMNLSKAEESIIKDLVNLIYTYEEKMSIQNSKFVTCLSENLNKQIAMYFLQLDADKNSGFLINDAVNFLSELNIREDNTIVKNFIKNGNGKTTELKKLSGCSLQQFAELIENLILVNKTKNENDQGNDKSYTLQKNGSFYINILQQYLNIFVNFYRTTNLYLFFQMKKNNSSHNEEKLDNLEIQILDKLVKYNEKYVDKKNLSLDYLLSKEELNNLRKNNISKRKDEEKELLLIEKKKLEEKIQLLLHVQLKKNLTETEIKRLHDLKTKLRNIKYTIKKEELKRYFC